MKYSTAIVAASAALVSAQTAVPNITYVTEVIPEYVTYCPEPTTLTFANKEVVVTEATTITINDCTVVKPVTVTSHVECETCKGYTPAPVPIPANTTVPGATGGVYVPPTGSYIPTGSYVPTPSAVTAGAGKAMAVSGAGLAGVLAVALAL